MLFTFFPGGILSMIPNIVGRYWAKVKCLPNFFDKTQKKHIHIKILLI